MYSPPIAIMTVSKAIPATQDLLQANKDVVAIFGHNDDMAAWSSHKYVQNRDLQISRYVVWMA